MLDLHFWPTPNGKKVTILLEELGLDYNLVPCNIGRGDQFKPDFLKINPNHRMPVLVDHNPKGGGAPISIFESGAIMMYLAEKEGRFFPQDIRGRYEVAQWVIWQMANQGPKLGECGHFRRAGPEAGDPTYAIRRVTDETQFIAETAAELVGADNVNRNVGLVMASEDFSFMLNRRPGAYIQIGNGDAEGGCEVHNPGYDFNDAALPLGSSLFARLAERKLTLG